jgi:hypothetical protein
MGLGGGSLPEPLPRPLCRSSADKTTKPGALTQEPPALLISHKEDQGMGVHEIRGRENLTSLEDFIRLCSEFERVPVIEAF